MVEGNTPEDNSVLLSLRAIGLLHFYRDAGRALPAHEVTALVGRGRINQISQIPNQWPMEN